ncbi:hypothetical protein GCM10025738_03800 [Microbacterium fluvii]
MASLPKPSAHRLQGARSAFSSTDAFSRRMLRGSLLRNSGMLRRYGQSGMKPAPRAAQVNLDVRLAGRAREE